MDAHERLTRLRGRLKVEDVTELAPELADALGDGDGRIRIAEWTAARTDAYQAFRLRQRFEGDRTQVELNLRGVRGLALALSLCDAQGKLLFEEGHAAALGESVSGPQSEGLHERILAANGQSKKADEDLAKNLSREGGATSPSSSPGSGESSTPT